MASIVKTNSRHPKWALTHQQYNLEIVYVPGELQVSDIITVVGKQNLLYIGFMYSKHTFTPRHVDLHVAHTVSVSDHRGTCVPNQKIANDNLS